MANVIKIRRCGKDVLAAKIDTYNFTPIELSGDIIIIPNHADTFADHNNPFSEKYQKAAMRMATLNGVTYIPDTTPLVETWFTCNELGIDNFADHHPMAAGLSGYEYWMRLPAARFIPKTILDKLKEDETTEIIIPVDLIDIQAYDDNSWKSSGNQELLIHYNLTAAQTKMRYKWTGTFEETLEYVCA